MLSTLVSVPDHESGWGKIKFVIWIIFKGGPQSKLVRASCPNLRSMSFLLFACRCSIWNFNWNGEKPDQRDMHPLLLIWYHRYRQGAPASVIRIIFSLLGTLEKHTILDWNWHYAYLSWSLYGVEKLHVLPVNFQPTKFNNYVRWSSLGKLLT